MYILDRLIQNFYYQVKSLLPRRIQIALRRAIVTRKRNSCREFWPINEKAGEFPNLWPGWPLGKKFAFVLTHDVDTQKGFERCWELARLERELGVLSSFNFVPEKYNLNAMLRHHLIEKGFEVGVHGLYHDGKLYRSKKIFLERADRINRYLKDWGAVGFRSPSMHHNLEWIHHLNIEYDASTFDTDPFEPQSDGVRTIFPFWVQGNGNVNSYVELPYTLPQDFTLFILLKEKTINIWERKLDWISERGGMVLINTHPDYMNFGDSELSFEEYPVEYYLQFLRYIETNYKGQYWHALPRDVSRYYRETICTLNSKI
jgi:hypothetical protein